MSIWDRFFSKPESEVKPSMFRFGRYSDSYKSTRNYDAWDEALDKFEEKDYLGAYRSFFEYLRDEQEDNVKFWEEKEEIRFELYQGSKQIFGVASPTKLKAEAKIAKTEGTNPGFARRLLEHNFDLQYSRFALDESDNLTIVFDTYSIDGSPYKLYYALKELATNADKQDDLLLDEFKSLEQIATEHLKPLSDQEKQIKYQFLIDKIDAAFRIADNEKTCEEYPGGVAYLLLSLIYKLDYLIKPEGYMMEVLERANRLYFAKDGRSTKEKIYSLREEIRQLTQRPKAFFFKEMYRGISTFGITAPVNHSNVVNLINNDLGNMDWYRDNGYEEIAISISEYIIGYSLFNYAVPKPDRDLFHLYFQVMESTYFKSLGIQSAFYDSKQDGFKVKNIKKAIDQIVKNNRKDYTQLHPNTGLLRFFSKAEFAKSYLLMIRDLDLT